MKFTLLIKLILICTLCLSVGATGSFFTTPSSDWYQNLKKPSFNPPGWVFGPAWTILYILMGISAFLILQKDLSGRAVQIALLLFAAQLLLNAMWTPLFFGLKFPLLAFIDIVMLWFGILFTIVKFYGISKTAALLLIPYILWVTFASVLNFSILLLNR